MADEVLSSNLQPKPLADRIFEAFGRYATHDADCNHRRPYDPPRGFSHRPCTCGLDAVLEDFNRQLHISQCSAANEENSHVRLIGACDKCQRQWVVYSEPRTDVIVKAFHCPCGHTTVMD